MSAVKRLAKELKLMNKQSKTFQLDVCETNLLLWNVLLMPDLPPYNKGAFKIDLTFPIDYPFKPPKVTFKTKIYHPNIDERGQMCLPIISPERWKPATKADQVLNAVLTLLSEPEPEHPLRGDLAEEYTKDKQKFMKTAEDFTKKHAEKRPPR